MSWPLASGAEAPDILPGLSTAGPEAVLPVIEAEDRMHVGLLDSLHSAESEIAAREQDLAQLREELEATNQGLIALYDELELSREAEARLAAIVRSSDDAMMSVGPDGLIVGWNPGAERLLGYTAEEIVGRAAEYLVPERAVEQHRQYIEQLENGERAITFDDWRRRKNGSLVEVSVTLSRMEDAAGRYAGYSSVYHDLTDRRQIEERLAVARAEREVFSERERIARDLHDLVIQRLFASGMRLQSLLGLVADPALKGRIEGVVDELDATISQIRSSIFVLQVDQHASSVRTQLVELVTGASHSLGFRPQIRFEGPVETAVPGRVLEQLLAVAREALSNIARHASASSASVLVRVGDDVVLEVADDGVGMGDVSRRSGLANLAERAVKLRGTFEVTSEPGEGTRLVWRVPLTA
jgi:two-component system sensor histidine kinase DevS